VVPLYRLHFITQLLADCGTSLKMSRNQTDAGDCNAQCSGNATQSCGAGNRLQVYFNPPKPIAASFPVASAPANVGDADRWKYIGCYTFVSQLCLRSRFKQAFTATAERPALFQTVHTSSVA
jgi:hypothetical protein